MPLAPGHIQRFRSFDAIDFAQGVNPKALQPSEPVFLSDKCSHDLVAVAIERFHEPNPANSRSLLSVKGEYYILHDELNLPADQLTHWHLQPVADSHEGDWRSGYRFAGRYGTDLQVLLPGQTFEAEAVTQQPILEYGLAPQDCFAMRHLQLSTTSPDQVLAVIRPLHPGQEPVMAELLCEGEEVQGVAVTGAGVDDLHLLSRTGCQYTGERVRFQGRYASILRRDESLSLVLQDGGRLEADGVSVSSTGPSVSLTRSGESLTLEAEGAGTVTVTGPAKPLTLTLSPADGRVKMVTDTFFSL
ncbi:MAG: hypothetical protein ACYTGH_13225 [Planctomycetota bacterium]|jgi:hypothetical protein